MGIVRPMNPAARLASFAAVLAVVFALAMLAGARADLGRVETKQEPGHGMEAMGHGGGADPVRGLASSEHGLTLRPEATRAEPGRPFDLRFRVLGRDGGPVRRFDLEHTKRMHVILVRRDLSGFQHVHPRMAGDGTWSVPVTLPDPGGYRVYADFSRGGEPRTMGFDLAVDGAVRSRPLPAQSTQARVDGLDVRLTAPHARAGHETELGFRVTRGGRPVPIEDYLGAKGHLVALREGDLAFLHVHPDADRLRFMSEFATPGRYRLFLQFKTGRVVHTVAFTREVSR